MSIIEDLIPEDLNMTTSERLLLVADIITKDPDHWHQCHFVAGEGTESVLVADHLTGTAASILQCGTTFCAAGWGVATSPRSFTNFDTSWEEAGAKAFGLTDELADMVFYDMEADPHAMADKLRLLATLDEPRSLTAALAAGYKEI